MQTEFLSEERGSIVQIAIYSQEIRSTCQKQIEIGVNSRERL